MIQRLMHAGRPHEGGPACEGVHCWGCGRDGPRKWSALCGECFHAWRWEWLLSLHDAWLWWKLDRRIRIRRPGKIWVCPCCAHDL